MNCYLELDQVRLGLDIHLHICRRTEGNALAGDEPLALKKLGNHVQELVFIKGDLVVLGIVVKTQPYQPGRLGALLVKIANHDMPGPRRKEAPSGAGGPDTVILTIAEDHLADDPLVSLLKLELRPGRLIPYHLNRQVGRRSKRGEGRRALEDLGEFSQAAA